jgi:hypothetical protein
VTGAEVGALIGALIGPATRLVEDWLGGKGPEPQELMRALASAPGFSQSSLARARAHARLAKGDEKATP